MKVRIAQAALATIFALGFNATTHAFMSLEQEQPAEVQTDLQKMVESFRQEIAAGKTSCEDMLTKLDAAIENIDEQLDAGAANEQELLTARGELTKMRYDLECLANELTQFTGEYGEGDSGQESGGEVQTGSNAAGGPNFSQPTSMGSNGGGGGMGGGMGGLAGPAAGFAAFSAASNNGSDVGIVASGSATNN